MLRRHGERSAAALLRRLVPRPATLAVSLRGKPRVRRRGRPRQERMDAAQAHVLATPNVRTERRGQPDHIAHRSAYSCARNNDIAGKATTRMRRRRNWKRGMTACARSGIRSRQGRLAMWTVPRRPTHRSGADAVHLRGCRRAGGIGRTFCIDADERSVVVRTRADQTSATHPTLPGCSSAEDLCEHDAVSGQ